MKNRTQGWISGFIGVVIFAGSLPATRLAVIDFDPLFLTGARATIAALLGSVALLLFKQRIPKKADLPALSITAFGVVIGFPLFSALALQYVTSAHAIVFLGVLPICTAIFAVCRGDERPPLLFWLFAIVGSLFVAGYAALSISPASIIGSLLMLAAVITCGLGYAEGARLSRVLGGWQVISWALVVSLPIMLPLTIWRWPATFIGISVSAWIGLFYVSVFSMFIGFIFWYRGLAVGGIAAVGQLQLLQPFMGLMLAAVLLHESVSMGMLTSTLGAIVCVIGAKKYAV